MTKCTTCGGVYLSVLPDGTRYFHACPPLSDLEVAVALGAGNDPTKWTAQNKLDIAAAPRVRLNARNENVPDGASQKTIIAPFTSPNGAVDWKKANGALETAVTAAGGGTTIV